MVDLDNNILLSYSSAALPYTGGCIDLNEEEFLFENVVQTSSIRVTLFASKGTGKKNINICGGQVTIPMNRLEENIPVVQWYQLSPLSATTRCIKTSIKFEVCFFFESKICHLDSRTTLGLLIDDLNIDGVGTLGSGEYEGSEHGSLFHSAGDPASPTSHLSSPCVLPTVGSELHSGAISGNADPPLADEVVIAHASSEEIVTVPESNKHPFSHLLKRAPRTSKESIHEDGTSSEEASKLLPSGIADYCLLIGPSSIPRDYAEEKILYGSHANSSSSFRLRSQSNELVKIENDSNGPIIHDDIEAFQSDGDISTEDIDMTTELPEESNFSSVCIWDKYPLIGHAGSNHMPDKIEWFVFPDGPRVSTAATRPDVESTYFVLNAGDEIQWYGVGIVFYMRGFETEENIFPQSTVNYDTIQAPTFYGTNNHSEIKASRPNFVWMAVSLCVLTKLPYIDSLVLILKRVFHSNILPTLVELEEKSIGFPSLPGSLDLEKFLSMLCLESFSPLPGILDVTLQVDDLKVLFHGNSPQSWPYCPYDLQCPLRMIGVRTMMDLLYHAMAERKIILHSIDPSRLPIITESIRALIYPLKWCSAYIPVVPSLLLDLVEAPVPYILGVSTSLLSKISGNILKSTVLVNCDNGIITTSIPITRYPDEIDRWCILSLKRALSDPNLTRRISSSCDVSVSPSNLVQIILLDAFVSVFSWIPECIFNIGAGYPIFNSHMFLHGYCPSEAVSLAETIIDTQAFQRIVSEIHLPRLSLFINSCKRMRYGYGYCRYVDGVKNSSTEMYPLEDRRFGLDLEENLPLGELSNPRRLLRPPYQLSVDNNLSQQSPLLVPLWISDSFLVDLEDAILKIVTRYMFSLPHDERENVTHYLLLSQTSEDSDNQNPACLSNSSRVVAFPPLTFAVNSLPTSHKKKRKQWTFDDLESLWNMDRDSSLDTHDSIQRLRERYRQYVFMQSKLTKDLIRVTKRMHVEYMFGEDVIMRLILRILPLSTSDGIHDMDLAAALQQGSDSFAQGAARRSLVTILSEYCEQMSIRPVSTRHINPRQSEVEVEPKFSHEKCPVELSVTAFGYALRLCKLLLQACTVHKDYLTAHGLLEICGYFYHVLFEPAPHEKVPRICYIQNLRSRINRHPIYQNPTLWRTVINEAISNYQNRTKKKKKLIPLIATLKPILIHMCGSDLPIERMEDILNAVVKDFSLASEEHEEIIKALHRVAEVLKSYRGDKGSNLEDSNDQISIRLALHGGTPTRKQPLSPWHQILSPVTRSVDTLAKIASPSSIRPDTPLDSASLPSEAPDLSRQWSVNETSNVCMDVDRCVLLNPKEPWLSNRIARDIDMPSESLDIFARNVMFTPLPLDRDSLHETCVTSVDVGNSWSVSGDTCGNVIVVDLEGGCRVMQHKHNATITNVKFLPCGLIASTCAGGVLKISRGPGWQISDSTLSWTKQFSYRKSILAVHRPFTTAVTAMAVGVPYSFRGRSISSKDNVRWGQSEHEWSTTGQLNNNWLLAVGGASGGIKIYSGCSNITRGAGGAEVMSASSPDRGAISCLTLVSSAMQISSTQSAQFGPKRTCDSDHSEHRDLPVFVSPSRPNSLWSPSQSTDACIPGSLFIGTSKGGVVVYDLESRCSLFNCGNEDRHRALVASVLPVRTHELVSGGYDRLVKLWDIRSKSGECVDLTGSAAAITSLAIDEYNDHKIIASCADGFIRVWDTRFTHGRPYLILEGHNDRISCMTQKSGILVTGSYDGDIRSWSLSTGRCLQRLRTDLKSPVSCLALDAKPTALNSQDLVSISIDQSYASRKEDFDQPNLITLKNIWLACGGWEGSVRVWSGREV